MKYLYRLIIVMFLICRLVVTNQVGVPQILFLLIFIASNIFRLKYRNLKSMFLAEFAITLVASYMYSDFTPLLALTVYDIIDYKKYVLLVMPVVAFIFFMQTYEMSASFVLCSISGVYSFTVTKLEEKERLYRELFDKEREYNYQLERSRKVLLNSAKDAARIAEIKERNRIAREIHDNIGHSIAGTLMQLQAAKKLIDKGDPEGKKLLESSIKTMSEGLVLVRNTVHNIKPSVNMGVEYINEIISNFKFCSIDFKHRGDISSINPEYMEAIVANLKELLTNSAKYSNATNIIINLDVNEKYIRLFFKDNGQGCDNVKEGMGLSGIKERIRNIGGSVAINGSDGFTVVCLVPLSDGVIK